MSTISTLSQKWVKLLKYSSLYHQPLTEQPVCDIRGKWKFGACQATISVKKTYYLRLRFMCQDISRMQDFAPFTPELLGALSATAVRTTSQARFTGLIVQPNNFWDNLNFDLGCPNDY
jgi:hypothetical protein